MRADLQQMRMDMQQLRGDMQTALARTVDRDTHAAQLAALERRVEVLEQERRDTRSELVRPLVVGVVLALVAFAAGVLAHGMGMGS